MIELVLFILVILYADRIRHEKGCLWFDDKNGNAQIKWESKEHKEKRTNTKHTINPDVWR